MPGQEPRREVPDSIGIHSVPGYAYPRADLNAGPTRLSASDGRASEHAPTSPARAHASTAVAGRETKKAPFRARPPRHIGRVWRSSARHRSGVPAGDRRFPATPRWIFRRRPAKKALMSAYFGPAWRGACRLPPPFISSSSPPVSRPSFRSPSAAAVRHRRSLLPRASSPRRPLPRLQWLRPTPAPPTLRLSADAVRPLKNKATLTIDPTQETFDGDMRIELDVRAAQPVLWLNADGLTVDVPRPTVHEGRRRACARVVEPGADDLRRPRVRPCRCRAAARRRCT